jgi:hypothetical protein
MYRSVRADGRLSDMANLSRAKDAALGAAFRDLAWDTANSPRKAQQTGGVFSGPIAARASNRTARYRPSHGMFVMPVSVISHHYRLHLIQ